VQSAAPGAGVNGKLLNDDYPPIPIAAVRAQTLIDMIVVSVVEVGKECRTLRGVFIQLLEHVANR
jgi:hypothetical protein